MYILGRNLGDGYGARVGLPCDQDFRIFAAKRHLDLQKQETIENLKTLQIQFNL